MPVKIACPKCSKKYTLPDSALGKTVKCKACDTAFRTRKPNPAAQPSATSRPANPVARPSKPAQANPDQQANSDLTEFGVEGGFQKQADIFGTPPSPRASAGLGNFAEEGFGESVAPIVLGPEGGSPVEEENPFQSVMTNSALNRGPKRSGLSKRKNKNNGTSFDPAAYTVARVGMMMVLGAGAIQLAVGVLTVVVSVLSTMFQSIPEGLAAIMSIFSFVAFIMWLISLALIFFGQILCVFAPEANEKLNAGVSLGLMILTTVGGFVFMLVVGLSMGSLLGGGGLGGPSGTEAVAIGIIALIVVGIGALMALVASFMFVNYYRVIGKNISSKKLEQAGSQAMMVMAGSLGLQLLFGLLIFGLGVAIGDADTMGLIVLGITLVNWLVVFAMAAIILRTIVLAVSILRD